MPKEFGYYLYAILIWPFIAAILSFGASWVLVTKRGGKVSRPIVSGVCFLIVCVVIWPISIAFVRVLPFVFVVTNQIEFDNYAWLYFGAFYLLCTFISSCALLMYVGRPKGRLAPPKR